MQLKNSYYSIWFGEIILLFLYLYLWLHGKTVHLLFLSTCLFLTFSLQNVLLDLNTISCSFFTRMDEARQPLSRKIPLPSSQINPYRMIIIIRLVVLGFFFHYRVMHPVPDAFALWLISVICEIWFAMSWILDQFPKWFPIERETYLDRLTLRLVAGLLLPPSRLVLLASFSFAEFCC